MLCPHRFCAPPAVLTPSPVLGDSLGEGIEWWLKPPYPLCPQVQQGHTGCRHSPSGHSYSERIQSPAHGAYVHVDGNLCGQHISKKHGYCRVSNPSFLKLSERCCVYLCTIKLIVFEKRGREPEMKCLQGW